MDLKHTHLIPFIYTHNCSKCEINRLLNQLGNDKDLLLMYIKFSDVFTHWEKQYLKEKYQ